ncbi:hypothetical protein I79_017685 [Cricetulus griseus]|uniref:Uncharacterized protein n=1 Tax=Cricetulus griseus TaxID=10029 RepID=G3I2P2_CRIGR|nr:hypothetical protein I79_017685 [Cricetulus griseus]
MRPAGKLCRLECFTSFMIWLLCYRHQDIDTWSPGLAEQSWKGSWVSLDRIPKE